MFAEMLSHELKVLDILDLVLTQDLLNIQIERIMTWKLTIEFCLFVEEVMGAFTTLFIQEAKANPKLPDLPNKVILE